MAEEAIQTIQRSEDPKSKGEIFDKLKQLMYFPAYIQAKNHMDTAIQREQNDDYPSDSVSAPRHPLKYEYPWCKRFINLPNDIPIPNVD